MKPVYIFLLTLSFNATAQNIGPLVTESPDKKFRLSVSTKEMSDSNTEWNYWLREHTGDSILITTSILHDIPAPVAYWNTLSTQLVYEEQTYHTEEIRVYDLVTRKLVFQTIGFIPGYNLEYFDQARGIVIFFKRSGPDKPGRFDLVTLNTETFEINFIRPVETSGDPYTGTPEVLMLDRVKRKVTLVFETRDEMHTRTEKLTVGY